MSASGDHGDCSDGVVPRTVVQQPPPMHRSKRASVTNVAVVLAALLLGRCTADLPAPPDTIVFCAEHDTSSLQGGKPE